MIFRVTAKALLVAIVVIATPAGLGATNEVADFTRVPFVELLQTRAENSAKQQAGSRVVRDTTKRDSAGGRQGQNGQGQRGAQGAEAQSGGTSLLRTVGLGLIGVVFIGAAVFAFMMFRRAHSRSHDDIPIVFQPRENVPSIAEFPRGPSAPFRVPVAEPVVVHHPPNNKPPANNAGASNPVQGTMQLLPGRLEVRSGLNNQKEFRFVRVPGQANVTFGRYAGEPHTHIQVDSPTVSRKHATMRYHMGEWRITNLSSTNPVIVNGEQLPTEVERVLTDGDQVEMGEVIFCFHSR